jgi:hypothetical protein
MPRLQSPSPTVHHTSFSPLPPNEQYLSHTHTHACAVSCPLRPAAPLPPASATLNSPHAHLHQLAQRAALEQHVLQQPNQLPHVQEAL